MRNFTFFHCYTKDLWKGYEKNGFLDGNYGIRFMQNVNIPEELKFNQAAKKGGELYEYIKKNNCSFYIDRLQGGDFIQDYEYDQDLINMYKDMLGEKFKGFQMHEWFSNYRGDLNWKLGDLSAEDWTAENIQKIIFEKFPYKTLFLEAMTLEEMTAAGKPLTWKQYYDNMTAIYKKRAANHDLVPCDSYFLMYPFEAENGAKTIMPEVGGQIPDMRLQMAFARGVCRSYGLTLGAYYEPWGGDPFACCSYHEGDKNEWMIRGDEDFPFTPGGPNGGSSRSLQSRIFLYAYLSGAEMMSEEWGGYNTFIDCKDYKLSEYGIVKKNFLEFVKKYPDIGEKVAPIAAVISNNYICYTLDDPEGKLFGYPVEGKLAEELQIVRDGVEKIFKKSEEQIAYEDRIIINSTIPDAVDMLNVHDGKSLCNYRYLVDLTNEKEFAEGRDNLISPDEVEEKLHELLPCKVEGGFHYLLNKRGEKGYYLSVFNHSGITRSQAEGEKILEEATKTAVITLKDGRSLKALEGNKNIEFKEGKYFVTLKGGEWLFAEI